MAEIINRLNFTLVNLYLQTSKNSELYVVQAILKALLEQNRAKLFGKINNTLERFFNLADWIT
jgi:hypothetical protein